MHLTLQDIQNCVPGGCSKLCQKELGKSGSNLNFAREYALIIAKKLNYNFNNFFKALTQGAYYMMRLNEEISPKSLKAMVITIETYSKYR